MKCKICNSCLKLVRVDYPEISRLYWFCDFCYAVYTNVRGKKEIITDDKIISEVKKVYKENYG